MTGPRTVCAVDAGATWSKGALVELGDDVKVLAAASGGSGNPNSVGETMAASNLSGLLLRLHLAAGRDPRSTSGVCVGVSTPEVGRRAAALVLPALEPVCVPDVELLVAGGGRTTVAVVAGTGSIAVRADGGSRTYAGGHGWFLGDEGSATDLGRRALSLVLAGDASPALTDAVAEAVGAQGADGGDLHAQVYEWVYRSGSPQRQVPQLAGHVTRLARQGDPSALEVVARAVEDLVALADGLGRDGDTLVFGGSVAAALEADLRRAAGRWDVVHVRPDGVAGAVLLAAGAPGDAALLDEVAACWGPHRRGLSAPWRG